MGISEDARAMKSYIEKHGWTKGIAENVVGEVCLAGAYNKTHGEFAFERCIQEPAMVEIRNYVGVPVTFWNDAPERTKEEVLDMLENVAIKYDTDEFRSKGINADG